MYATVRDELRAKRRREMLLKAITYLCFASFVADILIIRFY
jgi:hypothetical protein